jgi:hypothetical protein
MVIDRLHNLKTCIAIACLERNIVIDSNTQLGTDDRISRDSTIDHYIEYKGLVIKE